MALRDTPMLEPENYEKWLNNMMFHLGATSDEMIIVIRDDPAFLITKLVQSFPTSTNKDTEKGKVTIDE